MFMSRRKCRENWDKPSRIRRNNKEITKEEGGSSRPTEKSREIPLQPIVLLKNEKVEQRDMFEYRKISRKDGHRE